MSAAATTCIDLIRHGGPEGGKRSRGQIDAPLSVTGWRQVWAAVVPRAPWQQVVSPPLARCHAFAAAPAERHEPLLTVEGEWPPALVMAPAL